MTSNPVDLCVYIFSLHYLLFYLFVYLFMFGLFTRLPTDVQAEAIPLILGGGDVLMVRSGI